MACSSVWCRGTSRRRCSVAATGSADCCSSDPALIGRVQTVRPSPLRGFRCRPRPRGATAHRCALNDACEGYPNKDADTPRPVASSNAGSRRTGTGLSRVGDDAVVSVRAVYESSRGSGHRPAHARGTVDSSPAFVRRMSVRVIVGSSGCGHRVGDRRVGRCGGNRRDGGRCRSRPGPAPVRLVRGDIPSALPSPDAQLRCDLHVRGPAARRRSAGPAGRGPPDRVSGAFIGVADADWGGALIVPNDPWLERGQGDPHGAAGGHEPVRRPPAARTAARSRVRRRAGDGTGGPVAAVPAASVKRSFRPRSSTPAR